MQCASALKYQELFEFLLCIIMMDVHRSGWQWRRCVCVCVCVCVRERERCSRCPQSRQLMSCYSGQTDKRRDCVGDLWADRCERFSVLCAGTFFNRYRMVQCKSTQKRLTAQTVLLWKTGKHFSCQCGHALNSCEMLVCFHFMHASVLPRLWRSAASSEWTSCIIKIHF